MAFCYLSTRLSMVEAYSLIHLCRQDTKHQNIILTVEVKMPREEDIHNSSAQISPESGKVV